MNQVLALSRPLDGLRRVSARARARASEFWRAHPREVLGTGLLGVVAAAAVVTSVATPFGTIAPKAAPPAPPPLLLKQVAPEQAVKINAEIPVASGPNPAASPFVFKGSAAARTQALNCLASAVYYEAGNQDENGERAVAQVVL